MLPQHEMVYQTRTDDEQPSHCYAKRLCVPQRGMALLRVDNDEKLRSGKSREEVIAEAWSAVKRKRKLDGYPKRLESMTS